MYENPCAPTYGTIIQFVITICIILPIIGINYYFCTTPKSSENKDILILSNEIEDGSQKNAIKQIVPRKIDNSASRRIATQAYVSILGNLGVALASLSAIDNN